MSQVGPTAIPADEGDDARHSFVGKVKVTVDMTDLHMVVVGGGVDAVTPRNVTNDDDGNHTFNDKEEETGTEIQIDDEEDDESEYSYTYEDEDEGLFTGFLIPTEQFETANNISSASIAAVAADDAEASERKKGAAIVVAEDGATPLGEDQRARRLNPGESLCHILSVALPLPWTRHPPLSKPIPTMVSASKNGVNPLAKP